LKNNNNLSRRNFLKSVGVAGIGAASLQLMAACAPAAPQAL